MHPVLIFALAALGAANIILAMMAVSSYRNGKKVVAWPRLEATIDRVEFTAMPEETAPGKDLPYPNQAIISLSYSVKGVPYTARVIKSAPNGQALKLMENDTCLVFYNPNEPAEVSFDPPTMKSYLRFVTAIVLLDLLSIAVGFQLWAFFG